MSAKVNNPAILAQDPAYLYTTLYQELAAHARRINSSLQNDGSETSLAPIMLASYTVAQLLAGTPSASKYPTGIVYVSNGTSNKRLAVSDGTTWRFPDGNVVS